jgi:hypothetical protein
MLHPAGIYLLDFESVAFVWVGKLVPKEQVTHAFKLAADCMLAASCKGKQRLFKMSISIVFYGYEPEIFKAAFKQGWVRLDAKAIAEEDEDEDDNSPSKGLMAKAA